MVSSDLLSSILKLFAEQFVHHLRVGLSVGGLHHLSHEKAKDLSPLTCPKCQGEMRIISFIDQPDVIKKILDHLGLWEEAQASLGRSQEKEITFDPSYSQIA